MTVAATSPLVNLVASSGQTVFNFGFRCDESDLLYVYVSDAPATYSVSLNSDQIGDPGGVVTLSAAPGTGAIVSIERDTPEAQNTTFSDYQAFKASSVEAALDEQMMIIQELQALLARAIVVSRANEPTVDTTLPSPTAGSVLGWVPSGLGFALGNVTTAILAQVQLDTGPAILRRNRGLSGTQDGVNRVFTLPNTPLDGTSFDLILGGLIVPQSAYSSVGPVVTFNPGQQPQPGQTFVADIYSSS